LPRAGRACVSDAGVLVGSAAAGADGSATVGATTGAGAGAGVLGLPSALPLDPPL